MTTQSVAIVFGPTLLRPETETLNMAVHMVYQNQIVELILLEYESIFGRQMPQDELLFFFFFLFLSQCRALPNPAWQARLGSTRPSLTLPRSGPAYPELLPTWLLWSLTSPIFKILDQQSQPKIYNENIHNYRPKSLDSLHFSVSFSPAAVFVPLYCKGGVLLSYHWIPKTIITYQAKQA